MWKPLFSIAKNWNKYFKENTEKFSLRISSNFYGILVHSLDCVSAILGKTKIYVLSYRKIYSAV